MHSKSARDILGPIQNISNKVNIGLIGLTMYIIERCVTHRADKLKIGTNLFCGEHITQGRTPDDPTLAVGVVVHLFAVARPPNSIG